MSDAGVAKTKQLSAEASVNVHKNAKMTALGRVLAVRRVGSGESIAQVAHGVGLSVRRLREWVRRWDEAAKVEHQPMPDINLFRAKAIEHLKKAASY